jgi:hypothetical protein
MHNASRADGIWCGAQFGVRRIVSEVKAVLHRRSDTANNQRSDNQADQLFQHILDRRQPVRGIRAVDTVHRVMGFRIDKNLFYAFHSVNMTGPAPTNLPAPHYPQSFPLAVPSKQAAGLGVCLPKSFLPLAQSAR